MNDYGQSPSKKKKDTDRLSPNNELVVVFFFSHWEVQLTENCYSRCK